MKFSIVLIAAMAQVASATFGHYNPPKPNNPKPECGTTTIREVCKTATKTSYSHYPTVTETVTKKKNACEIVKTTTKYSVSTSVVKVTVPPTITSTVTAPKKVVTASACVATVTYCPPKHYKRHFLEERLAGDDEEEVEDEEEDEYAGLTNAERIRRGLPLAKPVDKRTWGYDHGHGKPQPPKAGPSCVPKTVREETTKTITKSVTPTKYVTSTKCAYTQTVQSTVYQSSCKTETQTVVGHKPTTITKTVTPTSTKHVQFTTTVCPSKRY